MLARRDTTGLSGRRARVAVFRRLARDAPACSFAGLIDLPRVRADTPGCRDVVHLNNAGASLPTRDVVDTVVAHLELEARIGGYAAADEVTARTDAVYDSVEIGRAHV